jgi:cell shape-determining protein MreD
MPRLPAARPKERSNCTCPEGRTWSPLLTAFACGFVRSVSSQSPYGVRVFTLAVFFLLALRFSQREVLQNRLVQLTCIFLFDYGLFIAMARYLFDDAISFDMRILAPAYVAAMIYRLN